MISIVDEKVNLVFHNIEQGLDEFSMVVYSFFHFIKKYYPENEKDFLSSLVRGLYSDDFDISNEEYIKLKFSEGKK